jgi:tryptophan-rich sensory protein
MAPIAPKHPWIDLIVLVALCFAASGVGGAVTYSEIENWYAQLAKPSWTPPDWVFGPVWSVLYLGMAVAAWMVWRQGGVKTAWGPLGLFAIQLALNAAWSWLFFGLQSPGLAFVEIVLLWAAIATTTIAFWHRSFVAGLLFVPYLAWVTFAGLLNFSIWRLNA